MSTPLRDRAEHAAKYGSNLVVPATEIKQLLDELDGVRARLDRQVHIAFDAPPAPQRILVRVPCPRCGLR